MIVLKDQCIGCQRETVWLTFIVDSTGYELEVNVCEDCYKLMPWNLAERTPSKLEAIYRKVDKSSVVLKCASVNCDRTVRKENKVSGRLDLNYGDKGPAIWVQVYLCDVCMDFVRRGFSVPKGAIPTIADNRDEIALAVGCRCAKCEEWRHKQLLNRPPNPALDLERKRY